MLICTKCKKEMRCENVGVSARWNGTHAYRGDLYRCPTCHNTILWANNGPIYCTDLQNDDIYMDDYLKKARAINLRREDGPILQRADTEAAIKEIIERD